jgi:hypothetical protein
LLKKFIDIIEARQNVSTDKISTDFLIIVSQEISKAGYGRKSVSEAGFEYPVFPENVECFGVRLGGPELLVLDEQLGKHDATVRQKVQIMKQSAAIDPIRFETFMALVLDRPEQGQVFPDPPDSVTDPFH